MYQRSFCIGSTFCHIRLRQSPCRSDENTLWFGFPLFDGHTTLTRDADMGGYFLRVSSTPQSLSLAIDLCGGFRLYYFQAGEEYWYSDDYIYLLSVALDRGEVAVDYFEYEFWLRHRYTTGSRTYFRGLNKVAPGATIWHGDGVRRITPLALPSSNHPDAKRHTSEVESDLRRTLTIIRDSRRQVLLSFSGGADSTLLAILCREEGIQFTPIFLRAKPEYAENDRDWIRAKAVAHELDLQLITIETPLELDHELGERISSRMLFDLHVSLLHFSGMREVASRCGANCIILSGQGADSVLSFGPTQQTRGDFVARLLATYPFSLLSSVGARLVSRKLGKELRPPSNAIEFMRSFFDQECYYSLLKPADKMSDYLDGMIQGVCQKECDTLSHLMRLKIHGFLQGSDNQVVIQSAMSAGIDAVVLPFVSPAIINATVEYKNQNLDLFQPKYPVRRLLRKFGHTPVCSSTPARSYEVDWSSIEEQVAKRLETTRLSFVNQPRTVGVA
jgi:Asparagine synthase